MVTDVIAVTTVDWKLLLTIGVLAALVIVLVYRLMRRDPSVRVARYGLFVEREKFDDEPGWPQPLPPENRELPTWHDKTAELPPDNPAG
jgi:hypothetical protein